MHIKQRKLDPCTEGAVGWEWAEQVLLWGWVEEAVQPQTKRVVALVMTLWITPPPFEAYLVEGVEVLLELPTSMNIYMVIQIALVLRGMMIAEGFVVLRLG